MAFDKIYLLPQTILIDVDALIRYEFVKVKDIYNMIKQRYKQKVKFTKKELAQYIELRKKELNATNLDEAPVVLLPAKVNSDINIQQDSPQDNAASVNIRNKAQVLEFFKNKIMKRISLIEEQQGDVIDPYLEALIIQYTKEMHSIIEKEIKLQLEIEESSKLEKIIEERLGMIFILLKSVISKYVDSDTMKKMEEDFEEVFEAYKFGR